MVEFFLAQAMGDLYSGAYHTARYAAEPEHGLSVYPICTQQQFLLRGRSCSSNGSAHAAVWEMFYCESAYEGLMEAQICVGVCDGSLRPQFNETCPLAYQKLATQCWSQDPEER